MDKSVSSNYRPIALPTAASKLLELILKEKLSDWLYTSDAQFGFKSKHGTDMAIYSLKETIKCYTSSNSPVFVCFMDASKAFDRLNHRKLFEVLRGRGAPEYIIRFLSYWYFAQKYYVKWGHSVSSSFSVSNGIRQGGLLSPLLYNVYTDDLSRRLKTAKIGCHIAGECLNHISYADDMALLAPSIKALQAMVELCIIFAEEHDIIYNAKKTVCMTFWPRGYRKFQVQPITMRSTTLSYVQEATYLGHILSADLKDNLDMSRQMKALYAMGNTLVRKFGKCSDTVKCELFRAYCEQLYCSTLWCCYTLETLRRLRVSHNDVLRRLLGFPRWTSASSLFVAAGLNNLDVLMRKAVFSFRTRLATSENRLISGLYNSSAFIKSKLYSVWKCSLELS